MIRVSPLKRSNSTYVQDRADEQCSLRRADAKREIQKGRKIKIKNLVLFSKHGKEVARCAAWLERKAGSEERGLVLVSDIKSCLRCPTSYSYAHWVHALHHED